MGALRAGSATQAALLAVGSRILWLAWAFAVHCACPAYDTSNTAAPADGGAPGAIPAL